MSKLFKDFELLFMKCAKLLFFDLSELLLLGVPISLEILKGMETLRFVLCLLKTTYNIKKIL